MTERNGLLDKLVGQEGAAEQLRKGVQAAKVVLDKAGVEHKALDESKVKALLDALGTKTDSFLGGLMDAPPSGLKEAVMKLVLSAIGEAPAEEEQATEAEPAMMDENMTMGKARRSAGQVKLLDDLIKTQEGLAQGQDELVKAIKALAPLNTLADALKAQTAELTSLRAELNTVKAQLGGRPRAASQAVETIEDNQALKDAAEKALTNVDKFWGTPKQ